LIADLKSLIFLLQNKRDYGNVKIGFGSRVVKCTFDGSGTEIGKDCYVQNSRFERDVILKDHCAIFDSSFANSTAVYPRCSLGNVTFGAYSYVNENSTLGGVTVGRFSSIGPQFVCGYGEHPTHFVTTSPVMYSTRGQVRASFAEKDLFTEQRQTIIGNDVWIGARVFVRDGVKIGDGALIAAGAVVTEDVAPFAIVGGVPAKVIRYRFGEEVIRDLLELKWWDWSDQKLKEAQPLLASPDIESFLLWAKRN
jgi:acetyltransferase-like isoleucine patch superfamily enzyme